MIPYAHGGLDWHPGKKGMQKVADISYAATVYDVTYNVNPDKGRKYGWQNPALYAACLRHQLNTVPIDFLREYPAMNITGGQRGIGRMGGDFWPAIRRKDNAAYMWGQAFDRYPENLWRNLDLYDWILAPGPDGTVGTTRLEVLKEGVQVCEARIFLEDTLLDAGRKVKIGEELAKRCQDALDEHHRAMWKTVWGNDEDLNSVGVVGGCTVYLQDTMMYCLMKAGRYAPGYYSRVVLYDERKVLRSISSAGRIGRKSSLTSRAKSRRN